MKKLNKVLMIVALAIVSATGLKAQIYTLPSVKGEDKDTATVGARMAYKVDPDAAVADFVTKGVFNASVFGWSFSPSLPVLNSGGNPATVTEPGYYKESEIRVDMPAAPTTFTLSVNEKSQPKVGTGCVGNTVTLPIVVVPVPAVAWPATQSAGACGAAATDIPLTLTGYGPWTVNYTVNSTAKTATIGKIGDNNPSGTVNLTIAAADLTDLTSAGNIVKITGLKDRISTKSLVDVAGTLPTNGNYVIYVYPTPATQPIQHIKNL